jgi:hypothetical protein
VGGVRSDIENLIPLLVRKVQRQSMARKLSNKQSRCSLLPAHVDHCPQILCVHWTIGVEIFRNRTWWCLAPRKIVAATHDIGEDMSIQQNRKEDLFGYNELPIMGLRAKRESLC